MAERRSPLNHLRFGSRRCFKQISLHGLFRLEKNSQACSADAKHDPLVTTGLLRAAPRPRMPRGCVSCKRSDLFMSSKRLQLLGLSDAHCSSHSAFTGATADTLKASLVIRLEASWTSRSLPKPPHPMRSPRRDTCSTRLPVSRSHLRMPASSSLTFCSSGSRRTMCM